ncbi:MAG: hypothetical protein VX190_08670, partial [Bacteroidota bacterium]|nr:hypothetical protein [Bacteroidota bacterium]
MVLAVCPDCCAASGCIYPNALNFDADATLDGGSCVFGGRTDSAALKIRLQTLRMAYAGLTFVRT